MYYKLIKLSCLLLFPLGAWAQKPITLKAKVHAKNMDSIIVVNATTTSIGTITPQYFRSDKDGHVTAKLSTEQRYNNIIIQHGSHKQVILGKSGETIACEIFMEPKDSIVFTNPKNTNALVQNQFEREKGGFGSFINHLSQLVGNSTPETYAAAADSVFNDYKNYLEGITGKDKQLEQYFLEQLELYKNNAILMYAANMLNKNQRGTEEQVQSFVNVSKSAKNLINDDYLSYPIYQEYVLNHFLLGYIYDHLQTATDLNINFNGAINSMKQSTHKQSTAYATAKLLKTVQKNLDQNLWKATANEFIKNNPKNPNAEAIATLLNDMQKFDAGQKALDFEFTTIEGKQYKLSDFKGKVVYLDFWASWCGPCRQQMPFAKEIKKHFADKDVVFLYVSIDDNETKWKNGITSMGVEGILTRSPGWGGSIPRLYNVTSIPAYFLIDKDGNFTPPAPRPSQKEALIKRIESLL